MHGHGGDFELVFLSGGYVRVFREFFGRGGWVLKRFVVIHRGAYKTERILMWREI